MKTLNTKDLTKVIGGNGNDDRWKTPDFPSPKPSVPVM